MEEFPSDTMERTGKIMRKSISTFLKDFQYFTTTPVLLLLPFSVSVLNSKPLFTSSDISSKTTLFPNLKYLPHPFISPSSIILITPFALSSLLVAKATIIQSLNRHKSPPSPPPFSSCLPLYKPLLITHLFNIILCTSINTTSTFLLLRIFSSFSSFGFFNTAIRTVCALIVSALITNVTLVCNLALVVAGMESSSGHKALNKAHNLLRKGRNSMALLLAFPIKLGLASLEALFCFRLVRSYRPIISMALEGMLIAYLYSIIVVLDTIACNFFIKSCRSDSSTENSNGFCNQMELV